MTDEAVIRLVQGHGHLAVLAAHDVAALLAGEGGVEAASIEEEDDLLVLLKSGDDGAAELLAEDAGIGAVAALFPLEAHIDDADEGHGLAIGPTGHLEELILARLDIGKGLEAGRGAGKHDGAALELGPDDGQVAGVVARGFILLVGGLVLLVDDDDAEVLQWGKDGAACADDDVGEALVDLEPLVVRRSPSLR